MHFGVFSKNLLNQTRVFAVHSVGNYRILIFHAHSEDPSTVRLDGYPC